MFEFDVLPSWLYWVLVASASVVAIAQAGRVMTVVARWFGDILDERLKKTVEPMLKEYSPNGEITEIKTLLELHIVDSQRQFAELRDAQPDSGEAVVKVRTNLEEEASA